MQQILTHLKNNIWHNQVTHPQGTQCRMGLNRHWKWFSRWKFYFLSPNTTRISIPNNFGVFPIPWPRFYLSPPHLTRVAKALTHLNPRRRELYFKRALMQFCCLTSGRPLKTIKLSESTKITLGIHVALFACRPASSSEIFEEQLWSQLYRLEI